MLPEVWIMRCEQEAVCQARLPDAFSRPYCCVTLAARAWRDSKDWERERERDGKRGGEEEEEGGWPRMREWASHHLLANDSTWNRKSCLLKWILLHAHAVRDAVRARAKLDIKWNSACASGRVSLATMWCINCASDKTPAILHNKLVYW